MSQRVSKDEFLTSRFYKVTRDFGDAYMNKTGRTIKLKTQENERSNK